ncbi:MAG: nuclear transport factor 2 family protein [Vicinamibacterales bacterium]
MLKLTNGVRRAAAAGTIALLMMVGTPVQAVDNPQVSAEIMALARAQWASEIAGESMAQQNATLADDYTEFNGDFPTLLVGKTIATRMGEVTPYDKAMYSDMQNGRVQTYGDTAILTYNFAGLRRGADGKVIPSLAKSSRVYVKQGGKWMLVHANFAPVAAGH